MTIFVESVPFVSSFVHETTSLKLYLAVDSINKFQNSVLNDYVVLAKWLKTSNEVLYFRALIGLN